METKISVVIPNYNGKQLLKKNLPVVTKYCPYCEIIVIDDASTDGSVKFVKKEFPSIIVIKLSKNVGFAKAVNTAAKQAKGKLLLLLNSDVAPRADFLKPAASHFKDKNVFAVGLSDQSQEDGHNVERGRGGAMFKRGFIKHFPLKIENGQTLWASGGSAIIDRKKFQEIGGFDEIFAPFYWEDIDLSYRARKTGLICLFEPKSRVDHYHSEGAIKISKSPFYIKTVSYKNQFLFVWKNISDPIWIMQHLAWLPYHIVKAILSKDIAFFVGFLWAFLRVPNLIVNYPMAAGYSLSDREVLAKFAK